MRIAFLGTPVFALPSLEALIRRGDTLAVFTQPDRPVGRKAILTPPPVKVLAESHGIPVYQFEKIRSSEGREALEAFAPDLMVTAAFGQLLSSKNLAIPRLGTINVHGSLLPKYRGASPIQSAIIAGESETGVTTMMTEIGIHHLKPRARPSPEAPPHLPEGHRPQEVPFRPRASAQRARQGARLGHPQDIALQSRGADRGEHCADRNLVVRRFHLRS